MSARGRTLLVGAWVVSCGARTGLDAIAERDATLPLMDDASSDATPDYFITFESEAGW